jgi:hypothetical protein
MSVTEAQLHQLIEEIEECQYDEAAEKLRRLRELARDPVYRAFMNAPLDDKPLTPEDLAATDEAEAEISRGESYSLEDIRRDIEERRERS